MLINTSIQTISQAATYGIAKQADLVGQQFSLLISLFYIAYLIAQYPANLLMQRYPAGKVITICFLLWGMHLSAIVHANTYHRLTSNSRSHSCCFWSCKELCDSCRCAFLPRHLRVLRQSWVRPHHFVMVEARRADLPRWIVVLCQWCVRCTVGYHLLGYRPHERMSYQMSSD